MSTTTMTVDCMHEFRRDSMKSISACRDMWMHSSVNRTAEERERKASWFDARLTKVDAAYSLAAKVIDVVPECQRALRVAARIEAEVGSNEYALEAMAMLAA